MRKTVLIVSSTGGHLDQALAVLPAFKGCTVKFATYFKKTTSTIQHPLISHTYYVSKYSDIIDIKLLFSLCINLFEFLRILFRTRPNLIVSTGAEIAVPAFCAALLFPSIRRVHIETTTSADRFSISGAILQYLSHRVYVQWPQLLAVARKNVVYKGRVY